MTDTLATTPTPAEVLVRAAGYLQTAGWCQNRLFADHGPTPAACAAGAIVYAVLGNAVIDFDYTDSPEWRLYEDALRTLTIQVFAATNGEYDSVPTWNDADDRTQQQVIEVMLDAAKRWHSNHRDPRDTQTVTNTRDTSTVATDD
jgi:hypothetical protein